MAYVQGFLLAVPEENKEKYKIMAEEALEMFKRLGCIGFQENWGLDVPDGKVTSFPMAVKLEEGEVCLFSWIIWPDKATCDAACKKMQNDPFWSQDIDIPFDGKRTIWGGFTPIFTSGRE